MWQSQGSSSFFLNENFTANLYPIICPSEETLPPNSQTSHSTPPEEASSAAHTGLIVAVVLIIFVPTLIVGAIACYYLGIKRRIDGRPTNPVRIYEKMEMEEEM
jgi:hypothetical protein